MSKTTKQKIIVLLLAAVYCSCFSFFSILNHQGFRTQMNDLGNADQAIWQASLGHLSMPVSNDNFKVCVSRFCRHANFIYWLIAPLYWFWPNPEILLIITSLACTFAGFGLFAIAQYRLKKSWWSLAPPIIFWLSPMVQDANLYDFHVVTIISALLVWMIWAFDTGRYKLGWGLLFLGLLCQEDASLMIFMYGAYLFFSGKHKLAFPIMFVSILYAVILLKALVPLFNHGVGMYMYGNQDRYRWLGKDLHEVFMHTGIILHHLSRPDRIRILLYFLLSGALAGLRAWPILLMVLPPMVQGMLTSYSIPFETSITGTYYWVCPEAFIILSCIFSSASYLKKSSLRIPWPLAVTCVTTLILSLLLSPLPYGAFSSWKNYVLPKEKDTLEQMIHLIPKSASVSVQNNLGAHLAHRNMIATYPWHLTETNYALFYIRYVSGVETGLTSKTCAFLCNPLPSVTVKNMLNSPDWGLIAHEDGFYLFGRGFPHPPTGEVLKIVDMDAEMFNRERNTESHFYPWVRYLNGQLGWRQIFNG